MAGSKRTSIQPKEWAKHLRPFGKKEFWSSVRNLFRSEEKKDLLANENIDWPKIDPEELKRNKEEYNRELAVCVGGEPDTRTPYIVAKRIDDGINEQSVIPEGLISEKMIEALGGVRMSPERMEENLRNMNELSKNGVQPLTHFKPITSSNPFLMSCPEPNQINPISPEKANEIFKDIRGRMGEPGPQSTDDLLPKVTNIPPMSTFKSDKVSVANTIKELREENKDIPSTNQHWELSVAIFWTPQTGFEAKIVPDHELLNQRGYMDFVGSGKIAVSIPPPKFSHECPCCD